MLLNTNKNNDKELNSLLENLIVDENNIIDEDVDSDVDGYFDDFVLDWAESVGLAITKEEFDKMFEDK